MDWAVGLTTAPRRVPTLDRTLQSVTNAGWSDVHIFSDGEPTPREYHSTFRYPPVGAWPNWYLGLAELYLRVPDADAYVMLQDDVVFCRNVRPFLEQVLWPGTDSGVVSVYCPGCYATSKPGFFRVDSSGGLIGALAYTFPNSVIKSLLAHEVVLAHRAIGKLDGTRLIDTAVGMWAHREGLAAYYHIPSLAQHIGEASAIWGEFPRMSKRMATTFVGESSDARQIL